MRAYISPFDNKSQKYLTNFRRNLTQAGLDVKSASDLWAMKSLFHLGPRRYLFLNWFEDRVLTQQSKTRWLNWPTFAYRLAAAKLQRIQIIWVRHNHRPHASVAPDWLCNFVYRLMAAVSTHIVVHSERYALSEGYFYLPHPLYEQADELPCDAFLEELVDAGQRVAVLGQVRPSKKLDEMLLTWPVEVPLLLAGIPSSEEYGQLLQRIATERSLDSRFILRRLEVSEFDRVLRTVKAIYIANPDHTMIVSGVFFHAAALGTPVMLRSSEFASEVSEQCRFAVQVNSAAEIGNALIMHPFPSREAIIAEAKSLYGIERFKEQLARLLPS